MSAETRPQDRSGALAAVAALADPSRRAVYDFVLAEGEPVTRDRTAEALGLVRATAAFQLDRLAAEGLLAVSYQRLTGRTGPGSGRPTKLYSAAAGEFAVSVPERRYDVAAEVLAAAVEESLATGSPVADCLGREAASAGRRMAAAGELDAVLRDYGYEPESDGSGNIVLRNCPFHRLARAHTDVVCGLNRDLLGAAVESDPQLHADPDPAPGRCCVVIRRS